MELALWIVALLASVAIAHFYYRRSGKSLSFYLLLDDQPLSRVDATVRERLSITFSYPEAPENPGVAGPVSRPSSAVRELHHLQVILSNSGVKAITFSESPTIEIPRRATILDASVIFQNPSDLDATIARLPVVNDRDQIVRVAVRMLNKGEFLVIKFLLSEAIDASNLKLHLLAEDLSRNIAIKPLPPEATKSMFEAASIPAILIGTMCALSAVVTFALVVAMLKINPLPSMTKAGIIGFFRDFSFLNSVSVLSFGSVFLLIIFGAAIGFGIGIQPMFLRHRIVLPLELRPPGQK